MKAKWILFLAYVAKYISMLGVAISEHAYKLAKEEGWYDE